MARRPRHPDKDVEAAIAHAEDCGWRVVPGKNHAKFKLLCPQNDPTGCIIFVWATPKNPGNHARDIMRAIHKCDCGDEDE